MPFIVSDYVRLLHVCPLLSSTTIKDEIIKKIEHIAALEHTAALKHINVSPRAIVATAHDQIHTENVAKRYDKNRTKPRTLT